MSGPSYIIQAILDQRFQEYKHAHGVVHPQCPEHHFTGKVGLRTGPALAYSSGEGLNAMLILLGRITNPQQDKQNPEEPPHGL